MIFDIIRFNTFAPDILSAEDEDEQRITLGAYLDREGYSEAFKQDYLLPITVAMWNTYPDQNALQLPAVALVRFMRNHHLLYTFTERPTWLTIKGGAQSYIDAMVRDLQKWQIHLSTPVKQVGTKGDGKPYLKIVEEEAEEEFEYTYDHIIVATHGDQALQLLGDTATRSERELLSTFKTSKNKVVLHSDLDHMPALRSTWAAWNYLTTTTPTKRNIEKVSLTYNMNILQHIRHSIYGDVLATLNPLTPPKEALTQGEYEYEVPLYTPATLAAQKRLDEIQDRRGLSFVGAWMGWGFHEDGCSSGLRAAVRLGVNLPWGNGRVKDYRRARTVPRLDWSMLIVRIVIWVLSVWVGLIEGIVEGLNGIKKSA
jgi:predicted NAD/FAD-binding protein